MCIFSAPNCEMEDIVFIVDSSGSIQEQNWPLVLNFMKNIVRDFTIGPNNVQIGIAAFGDYVYPQFQLNTYYRKEEILDVIDRIPFLDQSTNTQEALRYMRDTMFTPQNGDRRNAPNSAIVITDGVPVIPGDRNEARRLAIQEAEQARSQGISIFTIGVGPEITDDVLNAIANKPSSRYTFRVDQFYQLESILRQVATAACGTPPPQPREYCNYFELNSYT